MSAHNLSPEARQFVNDLKRALGLVEKTGDVRRGVSMLRSTTWVKGEESNNPQLREKLRN